MTGVDLLIAIDADTNRIVWNAPYREWPRMVPAIGTLSIQRYRDNKAITDQSIADSTKTYIQRRMQTVPMATGEELKRLVLLKEKCRVCWRWLNSLHNRVRQNSCYLPDIPLGKSGTNARSLFLSEQIKQQDMIAAEIDDNHHLIWLASNMEELTLIADRLAEQRNV